MKKKEAVNHPAHYGGEDNPYEAIKVIEAWELGFCLGNTVKYIARAGKKSTLLEDLKKSRWYLDREIKKIECRTSAKPRARKVTRTTKRIPGGRPRTATTNRTNSARRVSRPN